ncbi:hypothetical protein Q1695_016257 [Nippostrongylus brasiliensis]|nr:hypothetical protein Q1695_016257 [Nippostrongylus brasiliensis]
MFIVLLCLTSSVMSAPLPREISLSNLLDNKKSFSRAALDYYTDILHDYKDYVPKEIHMIFDGLTDDTKNEMVAAVNDIETGAIKIPKSVLEIVNYVSKRTPQLGDNVDRAIDQMEDNIGKLRPGTKTLFWKWWDRLFDAVSVPEEKLANSLADLIADFKDAYDKADSTVKTDVRTVWPEAYNLLESNFADNFAAAARKFADGGLTMDIHSLSADAAYPPPPPAVKISNRQRSRSFDDFDDLY